MLMQEIEKLEPVDYLLKELIPLQFSNPAKLGLYSVLLLKNMNK